MGRQGQTVPDHHGVDSRVQTVKLGADEASLVAGAPGFESHHLPLPLRIEIAKTATISPDAKA